MRTVTVFLWCGAAVTALGWLGSTSVADETAISIEVCVGADRVLRFIENAKACSSGEQRFALASPSVESEVAKQEKEKTTPSSPPPADTAAARMESLERRVSTLESAPRPSTPVTPPGSKRSGSQFMEPFVVVDRQGRPLAMIGTFQGHRSMALINEGGDAVAVLVAEPEGGVIAVTSGESESPDEESAAGTQVAVAALGEVSGFRIKDKGNLRMSLGTEGDPRNFALKFLNGNGEMLAGVGESKAGTGLVTIADKAGLQRANMMMREDGKPAIGVLGTDGSWIAALTQGTSDGGYFVLTNAGGVPMVDAGSRDGKYGVVRAGPASFTTAAGLGLPGSYILGKAQ